MRDSQVFYREERRERITEITENLNHTQGLALKIHHIKIERGRNIYS